MKFATRAVSTLTLGLSCMCLFGCPGAFPGGITDSTTPAPCSVERDCPDGIAFVFPSGLDVGQSGTPGFYSETPWPTVHGDSRNSDFTPFVASRSNRVKWTALDGAVTLLAPSTGPEGNIYVTTGQGPGHSHLHAFDRHGTLLWESAPQSDLDDLDSRVVGSAPLVDSDGDIYVSDSNQFWAFHSDGTVKWIAGLPEPDSGFPSAIITRDGFVGGITSNGDVVLFHRDDGSTAVPVFRLPEGVPLPREETPDGLWAGGLLDPSIINRVFNSFFGRGSQVANTPAVHPQTGRIYITAAGASPNEGVLYGIDLNNDHLEIAFAAPLGGGSGTSPAISPEGTQVYAVGGDDVMVAFDAQNGDVVWRAEGAGAAASPSVGRDGTIYTGKERALVALDPVDGTVQWRANYDELAEFFLRRRFPTREVYQTGLPVAHVNSVVTLTANTLWVVLVLGYEFSEDRVVQPHLTILASVDPVDGSLEGITELRDTNEGLISVGPDGSLYVSHSSLLSSAFFYGINPELPPFWRIPGPPVAGLSALEPQSYYDHARAGIRWVQRLNGEAMATLASEASNAAATALIWGQAQLRATIETVLADAGDEVDASAIEQAGTLLTQGGDHLTIARALVAGDPVRASQEIGNADVALEEAAVELQRGKEAFDIALAASAVYRD